MLPTNVSRCLRAAFAGVLLLLSLTRSDAATRTVTAFTDTVPGTPVGTGAGAAGDLRSTLLAATTGDEIVFSGAGTVTLNGPLPPITVNVTIDGGSNVVIDGNNLYRAFFVDSGTVTIKNITIQNVRAKGGNAASGGGGGGGGAGLGAGIFVNKATASVTVDHVAFVNAAAVGGNGAASTISVPGGGGGGLGANGAIGSTAFGGGGGGGGGVLGAGAVGGAVNSGDGGNGGLGGGGGGGVGVGTAVGGTGGAAYAGNGAGSANSVSNGGAGGFGGGGGAAARFLTGGAGGFGGGGGGGGSTGGAGGAGGAGGGGGGAGLSSSTVYAGGAGGSLGSGISGGTGTGSGTGSGPNPNTGGGGAAAGPAIFVNLGTLTTISSTSISAAATGGTGGSAGNAGGANATPTFNYGGTVNSSATTGPILSALATPPVITSPTSASITGSGATLGGNVTYDGSTALTEIGVVYSVTTTNAAPQISGTGVTKVPASGTATGVFTTAVTGLAAGTGYSYSAYATNALGTIYTSVDTFTTSLSAPVINSSLAASGTYGTAISTYTITAANTPTSYNATNLPPGLSINTTNGQITGTPTTPVGSPFSTSISATNGSGTDTQTLVFTINKAVLTISGMAANNKVYDGTTTGQPDYNNAALNGQVGSDAVQADVGAAATNFSDRNVGTGKTVTITGITLSGAQSNRYTLTDPTATANITAKALTVTGLTGSAKVYDGTTAAAFSGTAALQATETAGTGTTSDGKPYSVDSVTIGGTAAGTFATRNVGTAKSITVTGLSITGTGSTNYTITQPTGLTANVTAKPLTVAGVTAVATRVYDGTTVAGLSGTAAFLSTEAAGAGATSDGKPYSVDSVTVSGTAAGTFATRNVGTAKSVTVTGLTVSGTGSGNYTATQPTGLTADITAKALTVAGVTAVATRVYDGTTVAGLSGTAAFLSSEAAGAGTTVDGKPYSVDTIAIGGTAAGAFADRNVGTAKAITVTGITVAGTDAGNYTTTQPTGLSANVTAKTLTIAGVTAVATRVYDGTTVAGLSGTAAFLSSEAAGAGTTVDGKPYSVDTVNVGGTAAGAFADRNVGVAKAITVTGLSVAGTDAANYTTTQPTGLSADVTAKALSIAGLSTVASRTYDGTTVAGLTGTAAFLSSEAAGAGTTVDGKPYSVDTISLSGTAAGAFADRNAGTAKAVTVTGLTVAGTDSGNYTVTQPTSLTANITAKALTVAGVTAVATRTYDGTTAAGLSGTAAFLSSEAAGAGTTVDGKPYSVDTISISGTAAGAYANRNVGTAKAITVTGVSVAGSDAANYTVTQPTGLTSDVTAKALSIAGVTAVATRVYDGTTAAGLSGTAAFLSAEAAGAGTTTDGKPYSVDTISVGGTAAGAFADRNVGTAKTITVTGITVAGTDAGNYTATQPTGLTANVTAKALTIAGLSGVASRTYDGTTVAGLTGTAAFLSTEAAGAGTTVDGKPYSVDTISLSGTAAGAFADRAVGTAKAITVTGLSVSGTDSGNYTAVQPTGLTGNVTAKALTVAGVTASDKIYDATTTATLGGAAAFLASETAGAGTTVDGKPYSVDMIAIGGTAAGAFADKDVATGKAITVTGVTVTGTDAANYSVTQPTGLTAAVTKKTLTVSGVTASNKVYDGTTAATLSGTPTLQSAEAPGAGTTADGKPYTGDTFSAAGTLTGTFADRAAATGKTVSVAGVTLTGAQSGNYDVAALTATADITPKALTISGVAAVATRVYDGTTVAGLTGTPAFGAAEATGVGTTSDGIPYTVDSVTVGGTAAGAFADRNVGTAKAITVSGLTVTGTGAANYTATQPAGLTADVTVKALNVAGLSAVATRVYDTTLTAGLLGTPAFLTAEVAGAGTTSDGTPYTVDTIAVSGTAAGAFATKTIGTGKAITVTGLTVSGADSANYTVIQPTGLTANVTAAGLTISGITASNKIYDGNVTATLNAGTAALVGVLTGDTVTLTGTATGTFASKTVGTGKTVQVASLSLSGADAGNYTVTQPTTTANITAKTLTVAGITAAGKVYDGNATATPTYTGAAFTGVVSGDTVTLVTTGATATFSSKTVATGKTVTFASLTLGGADAGNYTLTQPTTTADITAKNLTVTGITASNKIYNGNTSASLNTGSAALVGVVSGDTTTVVTGGAIGTFSDANVGLNKAVQVSGLTLTGADAANYTLTQPATTATITPASVSIAISNLSFTYDGTPKAATITISPSVSAAIVYSNGGSAPVNAGTYTVTVNVTDSNYSGSANAQLVIAKAAQSVAFSITGSDFKVGASLGLNATASSGLPVTFTVISGSATLNGSTATITQVGAVTIRATQAGNDNYAAASADQSFTGVSAAKTAQTIAFGVLPNVASDSGGFTLTATASSGLPVSFTVVSGPAVLVGNRVVLAGTTGLVVVRASQAGNTAFAAAPDVTRAFAVTQAIPDIFFGDLSDDAGVSGDRGELIQAAGARLEAKTGDIAAAIFAGTNRGTVLIVAPTLSLNISVDFTIGADGTYSVPFTSAGRSLVLTGTSNGSVLIGRIATLRVGFSTPVQSRVGVTSTIAGIYDTKAVNNATGGTSTIVGANGQILVVANTGTVNTGAAGTVNTDGTFNLAATGATISGSVDAPTTTVSGTITVTGQAPVTFAGISAGSRTDRLINLSSRVSVAPNRTLITGFVIGGTESKRVLIRGVGPALAGFGVTGALTNPKLQLFDSASKLLLENDDWSGADTSAAFAQVGAFTLPAGSKDAAVLTTLAPGAYTVQITGGTETGVALAEIYDASANAGAETQRLINISTRGAVDTGANGLLIGGFVVTGNTPKKVLIRGVGPGLAAFGVTGTVADPRLAVYSGSTLVAQNDDWSTAQPLNAQQSTASAAELTSAAQSVGAFALGAGTKDAALVITLAPGAYTAQVSGANGGTGAAIVEIYELP
jgi:hypothetical protein